MKFEIGKYYKHTTGKKIAIRGEVYTTMYGNTLVAEDSSEADLKPVGKDESAAVNWHEISREEWVEDFSE